ncbi:unnamed protein product [Urochloa humidicola]
MASSSSRIRCFSMLASAALVILGSSCSCLQFTFPTFDEASKADLGFSPGSGIANGALQITPSTGDMSHRSGRVLYARETLKLWNSNKRTALTQFATAFVLNILPQNGTGGGEGMAFILTNNPPLPAGDSSGRWLGVTSNGTGGEPCRGRGVRHEEELQGRPRQQPCRARREQRQVRLQLPAQQRLHRPVQWLRCTGHDTVRRRRSERSCSAGGRGTFIRVIGLLICHGT